MRIVVNILAGIVHYFKKNTEALLVASKENGLQVNAEKTKYVVYVSRSEFRKMSQPNESQ